MLPVRPTKPTGPIQVRFSLLLLLVVFANSSLAQEPQQPIELVGSFVSDNCLDCHSGSEPAASFDLESIEFTIDQFRRPGLDTAFWEKLHRRTHTRQMPPPESDLPEEESFVAFTNALEKLMSDYADRFPTLGRVGSLRRLTRIEYQNAIRDLLAIEIDAAEFLPKDESSHGFDNITVEDLSTTRMSRYISAAQKISRTAVGRVDEAGDSKTVRLAADLTQEEHVSGLPFGTRGGTVFKHNFPKSGLYEFSLKLTRDRDEKVEGLNRKHEIDLLIDRRREHRFEVKPPAKRESEGGKWKKDDYTLVDSHLNVRIQVDAGLRHVGVTFPQTFSSLVEQKRQPFDANFNRHRHPRKTPAIYQVSIVGPFKAGPIESTVSRQLIFGNSPAPPKNETENQTAAAKQILGRLMRRAYRRPVEAADFEQPMIFFEKEIGNGFDAGIEAALTSILSNPNFLFKVEVPAAADAPIAPISDIELASRLSFFLWSSIPDSKLLDLAEQGRLSDDSVLAKQVDRMLRNRRAESLVNNFAAQWLHLRNLESITPDLRQFPDFDDNLRKAFRGETESLFREILHNDLSVLKLLKPDHAWLNQRLADHYDIAGVHGDHFRKKALPPDSNRGGILRHGSILMVTSYATRTSPTIRGNWILENILGTPAPPQPPNVPNLKENKVLETSTLRERLAQHREDSACAGCHNLMDPIGFSLENFDAVGRWRNFSASLPIDNQGALPDGTEINNVSDLEEGILKRPAVFAQTMTEKLMTFGIGRVPEPGDGPAIRKIVATAAQDDFRFFAIIKGIVLSKPFRHRED